MQRLSQKIRRDTLLRYLHENNNQREQHQGLDESESKNQRDLNSGTCCWVASQSIAGRRRHFALSERRQSCC